MLSEIINPMTILVSFTSVFGVFLHDVQVDKAIVAMISTPAIVANYGSEQMKLPFIDHHIHTEINTFSNVSGASSQTPATQPRNQDDKKYVAGRRLMGHSSGGDYSWPSI